MKNDEPVSVDFNNSEVAFASKTDKELKKMSWLFNLMSKKYLVIIGSKLALIANELRLPFVKTITKWLVFDQFCGGEDLIECQSAIEKLNYHDTLTVLDYSAEGKSNDSDLEHTKNQILKTIEFAATQECVPIISMKLTGLVSNEILEKLQSDDDLSQRELIDAEKFHNRVDEICSTAREHKIGVFIDAEETWMQDSIDEIVQKMMQKYNHEKVIVYNTYQMYRVDMLDNLKADYKRAKDNDYLLGAKLVRGAYMEKERERALKMNYPSPILPTKEDTDKSYNDGIRFCVDHYEDMASCNASHNLYSNDLQGKLISERGILKNHEHLNFSQLYGMSDYITFNLAANGYNVAKYLPYGPVREVIPYLIRRAEENTSVTGEMGRELKYLRKEFIRRGLR